MGEIMNDNKFIICNDEITANELKNQGCFLLQKNNDTYVFVNNLDTIKYKDYSKKVIFTNKLNF